MNVMVWSLNHTTLDIHLVSNGLLLTQMDEKLQETIRNTGTIVSISAYPVLFDKIDEIAHFLKERDIDFMIGWTATRFREPMIERFGYPYEKVTCNCVHLRDGKIGRCPLVQYLDYYNDYHGTSYDGSDGIIDLYDPLLTFEMLEERLLTPFDLCNCCGFWREDLLGEKWSQSK